MADAYPIPFDDALRLKALQSYDILDSAAEEEFEVLCNLVSRHFGVPIVLISLIDSDRQWFKCHYGLPDTETARDLAFCNYTILDTEVFCVLDATDDPRFRNNALVTDGPNIRFYAGAPLITPEGFKLGTLCLIDTVSWPSFSDQQEADLKQFASIAMDKISARKERSNIGELIEADAAERSMEEMHAYLSHEIRTPIGAMVGLAEIVRFNLDQGDVGAICHEALKKISRIGSDVCTLAEETLRCAHVGRVGLDMNEATIDLDQFCGGLIDFVREPANEKQIEFQINCPPKVRLYADQTKFGQMCRNLMLNAVKFTQPGGLVEIYIKRLADHGLEVVISDNGPGMTQAEIDDALTPFSQIGRAGQSDDLSLGIGLPLTKRLIELHGGRLKIRSKPEEGTRVGLYFPPHRVTEILAGTG